REGGRKERGEEKKEKEEKERKEKENGKKKKKKEGKEKGKREGERDPRRDHGADRGAGRPRLASGRARVRRAGRGKNRVSDTGVGSLGIREIRRNREDSGRLGLGFQGGISSSTTKQNFSARFTLGNFRDVTNLPHLK